MKISDNVSIDVINEVNNINLSQEELIDIFSYYYENYINDFLDKKKNELWISKLSDIWNSVKFIQQINSSGRDALVLSMMALTIINNPINLYEEILNNCNNIKFSKSNLNEISQEYNLNKEEKKELYNLFFNFQKEVFSRTYSQNKDFQKFTDIDSKTLKSRYNLYLSSIDNVLNNVGELNI